MSFYVSTATFCLLHCDEWDRVVALPRHKFVTGATLLQLLATQWETPLLLDQSNTFTVLFLFGLIKYNREHMDITNQDNFNIFIHACIYITYSYIGSETDYKPYFYPYRATIAPDFLRQWRTTVYTILMQYSSYMMSMMGPRLTKDEIEYLTPMHEITKELVLSGAYSDYYFKVGDDLPPYKHTYQPFVTFLLDIQRKPVINKPICSVGTLLHKSDTNNNNNTREMSYICYIEEEDPQEVYYEGVEKE